MLTDRKPFLVVGPTYLPVRAMGDGFPGADHRRGTIGASRVLRPSRLHYILFGLVAGLLLAGVSISFWHAAAGARLAGVGLLGLSLWMIRFEIARHNLHLPEFDPITRVADIACSW